MPLKWLHMQTDIQQSGACSSQHTAQRLMRVPVPCTQRAQLLNRGPTQASRLAKGLAVFHFPLPEGAVNTACPAFCREVRGN